MQVLVTIFVISGYAINKLILNTNIHICRNRNRVGNWFIFENYMTVLPFIFDHESKKTFVCSDSPGDVLQTEGTIHQGKYSSWA